MIVCADVIAWAATYEGPKCHAMLCDPPYHLTEITGMQRNGSARFGEPRTDAEKAYRKTGTRGFMGKDWDGGILAHDPQTWKALAQHLLPGAFLMAFASSRGWHRLACAMEDAGLIIHPSIFGWGFGSGFPKSTRIEDDRFEEYRYGLQSLKPALEPIIVAQVPYQGRPVESITQTGAGAWWIEGGRLAGPKPHHNYGRTSEEQAFAGLSETPFNTPPSGRWPANFCLQHTPQCERLGTKRVSKTHPCGPHPGLSGYNNGWTKHDQGIDYGSPDGTKLVPAWRCADHCPVAALDRQAGDRDAKGQNNKPRSAPKTQDIYGQYRRSEETAIYNDSGPASRFFHVSDWALDVAEQLATAAPVFYAGKASRRERDSGLDGMPLHARTEYEGRNPHLNGQYRIEHGQITGRKADSSQARNPHPTVKPIALTRWLATLLLPPSTYAPRRLLVPFCGTGSEIVGGLLAGWDEIMGIEQSADYCAIAEQRLAWWTRHHAQLPLL